MKLSEILEESDAEVREAITRAVKKTASHEIKQGVRCGSGPKAGKWVPKPSACSKRKDWKKVMRGRKIMRQKGALIHRKAEITKRGAFSKIIARINQRLSGANANKSLKIVGPKDIAVVG